MPSRKRWLTIMLLLLAFAPLTMADIGPKPGMNFEIEYETSPAPEINTVTLLECQQEDCADGTPLEELGPQGIYCDTNTECRSMAYGYSGAYFQLVLEFSDGLTLTSNTFTKSYFTSYYQVTVQAENLVVEEAGGRDRPADRIGPGCSIQL